jgi:hypothetical protein
MRKFMMVRPLRFAGPHGVSKRPRGRALPGGFPVRRNLRSGTLRPIDFPCKAADCPRSVGTPSGGSLESFAKEVVGSKTSGTLARKRHLRLDASQHERCIDEPI